MRQPKDAQCAADVIAFGHGWQIEDLEVRPVSRPPLHAAVTDRLRNMIIELQLRPGQRINELDLADCLEVSRTPLREALRVLQAEGLIVQHPNRSSFISHITCEETAELFEALAGIERLGGELAARRIDQEGLTRLQSLHDKMFTFHKTAEQASYFALNDRIHRAFVEFSGNTRLIDCHARLIGAATRIRYAAVHYEGRWDDSVIEHKEILEAIEARAATKAGALIEEHVRQTGALACEVLARIETPPPPRRRAQDRIQPVRES